MRRRRARQGHLIPVNMGPNGNKPWSGPSAQSGQYPVRTGHSQNNYAGSGMQQPYGPSGYNPTEYPPNNAPVPPPPYGKGNDNEFGYAPVSVKSTSL